MAPIKIIFRPLTAWSTAFTKSRQKTPPIPDLHSFVLKRWPDSPPTAFYSEVWRATLDDTPVCFVATPQIILAVENHDYPLALGVSEHEPNSGGAALDYLRIVGDLAVPPFEFGGERASRFRKWLGVAQWPRPCPGCETDMPHDHEDCAGEGWVYPVAHPAEFALFPGKRFDRGVVAQVIETLGEFFWCDAMLCRVVPMPGNHANTASALLLRGVRDDGAPGWRAFVLGLRYDAKEAFEVFK